MKRVTLLLVILIVVLSCKRSHDSKQAEPNSEANQLNDNASLLDTNSIAAISLDNILVSKSKADKKHSLGDIFLIPPFAKLPYGEMRRVIDISETSSDYVYQTEPAALNEAFKSLSIVDSSLTRFDTLVNGRTTDANLTFTFEKELSTAAKLKGVVQIALTGWKWIYKLNKGSRYPEKVLLEATFDTKGTGVELEVPENKGALTFGEIMLGKPINLPPITIVIPIPTPAGIPFPFPMKFDQSIIATTGPISLTGKMKYTLPGYVEVKLGFKYENDTWTDLSGVTFASVKGVPQKCSDFSTSVTLGVTIMKLEYALKPFGLDILSATMGTGTKAEATVQSSSPNWNLKTYQFIDGGIHTKFFDNRQNTFILGGSINFNENSSSGDFSIPCGLPVLTTSPPSSVTSGSANTGGAITSDGGSSITARGVCYSIFQNPTIVDSKTSVGIGTGSFSSMIIGLAPNTMSTLR